MGKYDVDDFFFLNKTAFHVHRIIYVFLESYRKYQYSKRVRARDHGAHVRIERKKYNEKL